MGDFNTGLRGGEPPLPGCTPLSNDLALSKTLPFGVLGGDPCSLGTSAGGDGCASLLGDVTVRGAGTGRGFLAGGGAAWAGLPLGNVAGGFGPAGGGLPPSVDFVAMLICLSLCFIQAGFSCTSGCALSTGTDGVGRRGFAVTAGFEVTGGGLRALTGLSCLMGDPPSPSSWLILKVRTFLINSGTSS